MLISLHKNATTTRYPDQELAAQCGIGVGTVRKWRHQPHRTPPADHAQCWTRKSW